MGTGASSVAANFMRSSDDRHAVGRSTPAPLIVRSFQQSSVDCREFREAIAGEELLQRSSRRYGENGTRGVKNYVKRVAVFSRPQNLQERYSQSRLLWLQPFGGVGVSSERTLPQRSFAKVTQQHRREPPPAEALRLPRICVGKTSHPTSTRGGLLRARRKRAASARQILLSSRNESRRQSPQNKWHDADAVYASASRRDAESSLPSK